jgi:hypothetical protein
MERFDFYKEYYDSEYGKDSIRLFVFEMNKNSYKIGLKNTHFANPTGLSNSKNYSTAHDIALLTAHCLKNHTLRDIFKRKVYICSAVNEKLCYSRYAMCYSVRCNGRILTSICTSLGSVLV